MITIVGQPEDPKTTLDCNLFTFKFEDEVYIVSEFIPAYLSFLFLNGVPVPNGTTFSIFDYEFTVSDTAAQGGGTKVDVTTQVSQTNIDNLIAALSQFPVFACATFNVLTNPDGNQLLEITWEDVKLDEPLTWNLDDIGLAIQQSGVSGGTGYILPEGFRFVYSLYCIQDGKKQIVPNYQYTPVQLDPKDCKALDFCLPINKTDLEKYFKVPTLKKSDVNLELYKCKEMGLSYGWIQNKEGKCGVDYCGIEELRFKVLNAVWCREMFETKQDFLNNYFNDIPRCWLTEHLPKRLICNDCLFLTAYFGDEPTEVKMVVEVETKANGVLTLDSPNYTLCGAVSVPVGPKNIDSFLDGTGYEEIKDLVCCYKVSFTDVLTGNVLIKPITLCPNENGKRGKTIHFLHPKLGSWDFICFELEEIFIDGDYQEVCKNSDCGGTYSNYDTKLKEEFTLRSKEVKHTEELEQLFKAFKASNCRICFDKFGNAIELLAQSEALNIWRKDGKLTLGARLIRKDLIDSINK